MLATYTPPVAPLNDQVSSSVMLGREVACSPDLGCSTRFRDCMLAAEGLLMESSLALPSSMDAVSETRSGRSHM